MGKSLILLILKLLCLALLVICGGLAFYGFFEGAEYKAWNVVGSTGCGSVISSLLFHCPFAKVGIYLESVYLAIIILCALIVAAALVVSEKARNLLLIGGVLMILGSIFQIASVADTSDKTGAKINDSGSMMLDVKLAAGVMGLITAIFFIVVGLYSND